MKVFISYRRDDSAGHAGRIHDRLEREFGRDLLFMDVDSIPLGADFARVLGEEVAKCDVLLAVIGPDWCDARDEDGRRRLDDQTDFVRVEIASALQRGIPVVPILVDDAAMPKPAQLSDDIRALARRNGISVRHVSFHADVDRLIRGLSLFTNPAQPPQKTTFARPAQPPRNDAGDPAYCELLDAFTDFIGRSNPNAFFIVEDANKNFVQFVGVAEGTVTLDLPCVILSPAQVTAAKKLLEPLGVTLQSAGHAYFQGFVPADPQQLTSLTLDIFEHVYGGPPQPPLKLMIDE